MRNAGAPASNCSNNKAFAGAIMAAATSTMLRAQLATATAETPQLTDCCVGPARSHEGDRLLDSHSLPESVAETDPLPVYTAKIG